MGKDVYLSLDLDFFDGNLDCLISILGWVAADRMPFGLYRDHDEMLAHVGMFPGARRLVNLDAHSDLMEKASLLPAVPESSIVNCGNWVGFVPGRGEMEYVWVDNGHGGHCHYAACPFEDGKATDWGNVVHVMWEDFDLETEVMGRTVACGMCVSPEYLDIRVGDVEYAVDLMGGEDALASLYADEADASLVAALFSRVLPAVSKRYPPIRSSSGLPRMDKAFRTGGTTVPGWLPLPAL